MLTIMFRAWLLVVALAACKSPPSDAPRPAPVVLPSDDPQTHVIPRRRFRHSSVRGDFRVVRSAAGVLVTWSTELSARDLQGKLLWRKPGFGRALGISLDGKQAMVSNDQRQVVVLDVSSGRELAPVVDHSKLSWIDLLSWQSDDQVLAASTRHRYLLDGRGALVRELPVAPSRRPGREPWHSCLVALPGTGQAIVCDIAGVNGERIARVDSATGAVLAESELRGARDAVLSDDRSSFVIDGYQQLALFDARTLKRRWAVPHPGQSRVRFPDSREGSSEVWKPLPKLSPDQRRVAVNDQSGRLWLLAADSGTSLKALPRTLVDFVEDSVWIDDHTLVIIDNDGHVLRLDVDGARIAWSVDDAPEPERWDSP
jgi:hypothetical protein